MFGFWPQEIDESGCYWLCSEGYNHGLRLKLKKDTTKKEALELAQYLENYIIGCALEGTKEHPYRESLEPGE